AQAAVVVDVGRLQAHAGELAEEVGFLGCQACPAEQPDRAVPVSGLETLYFRSGLGDGLRIADSAESGWCRLVAVKRRQQAIGMRALEVPLDPFRTEHAAIEGKILPRLEPDDLVVLDLEL